MSVRITSALLGVLTLSGVLWFVGRETSGLRALTSSALPVVRARVHPAFDAKFRTAAGATLATLPGPGALRVVEVTYERCRTVCAVQGQSLANVYRAFEPAVRAGKLHFVSLSVDPDDCPAGINRRVLRLSGDVTGWSGLCVANSRTLSQLAGSVGLVAVRDANGEYRHTAGIFLVSPNGHVMTYVDTLDTQKMALAVQDALASTGKGRNA